MLKDLKAFLLRGNVVDLAVGVVIASAFGAIVTSLVNDIILNPALKAAKVERIAQLSWHGVGYGNFLSAIINFIFVGTALFFIIKGIEKAQKLTGIKEEKTAEKKPTELEVLQEIKALLEKK